VQVGNAGLSQKLSRWKLGEVGNIIEQRSAGIKDLRQGAMLEEDWKFPRKKRTPVPPLAGVHYHVLVGSLMENEKSLLARYFGDGLVTQGSAVAKTLLSVSTVKVFSKTGHNSILTDSRVRLYIKKNLGG
jgi:hypothetical protein